MAQFSIATRTLVELYDGYQNLGLEYTVSAPSGSSRYQIHYPDPKGAGWADFGTAYRRSDDGHTATFEGTTLIFRSNFGDSYSLAVAPSSTSDSELEINARVTLGVGDLHVLVEKTGGLWQGLRGRHDRIEGSIGDDTLVGGIGNDTIFGGSSPTVFGSDGHDRIFGGSGYDELYGGMGSNFLYGGDNNDVLQSNGSGHLDGGAGNDTFYGGSGVTFVGGMGNDTAYLYSSADQLIDLRAQTGRVTGVENVQGGLYNDRIIGTAGANNLMGWDGDDKLYGGAGNDTLDGGNGADTMTGGVGNDLYDVDSSLDRVVEALTGGIDQIRSYVDIDLMNSRFANVENVTLYSDHSVSVSGNDVNNIIIGNAGYNVLSGHGGNDSILGGDGNDTLNGGAGKDTLDGGVGADRMEGGAGNDIYWINTQRDVIVEAAGGGADRVNSKITIDLQHAGGVYANVEHVTLRGAANANATGSEANNTLVGNSGNNLLFGRGGNDHLTGGDGSDTFVFARGGDRDTITDFRDDVDQISLRNFGISSFAEARNHATQVGSNVVFDFGDGDVLTVRGTTIAVLSNDLTFA